MQSLKEILEKRKSAVGPVHAKHEFQEYGIWLSEQLNDKKHKALYIKLSKEKPRAALEQAMVWAIDYNTNSVNRGRLFMWKLSEMEKEKKNEPKEKP